MNTTIYKCKSENCTAQLKVDAPHDPNAIYCPACSTHMAPLTGKIYADIRSICEFCKASIYLAVDGKPSCESPLCKGPSKSPPKALFESNASATLDRVKATFCQRGSEYGDTWRSAQWLAMKATGKSFGITLNDDQWRALAAGCLVDVKYWRLMGGYKEDTGIDGIAYGANWVEIMRQFEKSNVPEK